jgi:hypothetical protein
MTNKIRNMVIGLILLTGYVNAEVVLTECVPMFIGGSDERYVLNNDISITKDNCINIESANNLTLDCQGHRIGNGIIPAYYNTIYVIGSTNIQINNCTTGADSETSISITTASAVSINNLIVDGSKGIYVEDSVVNVTNSQLGYYSPIEFSLDTPTKCISNLTNVTSEGTDKVEVYNSQTIIENRTIGEIVLCNALGTTINNITVGSTIELSHTNDTTIKNSVFDSTSYQSKHYGILIDHSDNNSVTNITYLGDPLYYSYSHGIYFSGGAKNNNITNVTLTKCVDGAVFYLENQNNTITSSLIQNSTSHGVYFYGLATNNTIYNNHFKNTINVAFESVGFTPQPNAFNVTPQNGTRIYSAGTQIGGNYYSNPTNNGYSDTCTDNAGDGFCDTPYTIYGGDNVITDYYPYSTKYGNPTITIQGGGGQVVYRNQTPQFIVYGRIGKRNNKRLLIHVKQTHNEQQELRIRLPTRNTDNKEKREHNDNGRREPAIRHRQNKSIQSGTTSQRKRKNRDTTNNRELGNGHIKNTA